MNDLSSPHKKFTNPVLGVVRSQCKPGTDLENILADLEKYLRAPTPRNYTDAARIGDNIVANLKNPLHDYAQRDTRTRSIATALQRAPQIPESPTGFAANAFNEWKGNFACAIAGTFRGRAISDTKHELS